MVSNALNFVMGCIFFSFCFLSVHLVIPGLNETTLKLPTSIMFEISDAIKTQLGKQQRSIGELCSDSTNSDIPRISKGSSK